jgi:hypothetical protein
MRIDGSTESAHRTFPTLRQRGRVFSLRCLYLSPGRPVEASCSRRGPPRRLQVFGPVRERRRAARSQSFLRRPIASLPSAVASKKQRLCQPRHEPGTMLSFPKIRSGRIRAVKGDIEHHRMARLTNDRLEPCRDPGARPELHLPSPAAQTRIVSVARIRLDSRKSVRSFKGIICGDISEFESYMPSQARWLATKLISIPVVLAALNNAVEILCNKIGVACFKS